VFLALIAAVTCDWPCVYAPPCTCDYVASSVDCSHNGLTAVPPILNNLTGKEWHIDLSYNNITSIPDGTFGKLSISGLYLQYNQLSTIGDNVFNGNEHVIFTLYLHFNNFTEVPKAVSKLTTVYEMTVQGNPIGTLNIETLSGLAQSLNQFSFGSSSLQVWPKDLKSLPKATWLTVYGIPFETLPEDSFHDDLFILNISDSSLTSLSNTLNNKPRLFELHLVNNPKLTIKGLAEGGFTNASSLRTLSIVNCNIDTLPPIFDNMMDLGEIILTGNPIKDMADNTFPHNYTTMFQFTIRESLLERIPATFSHMTKLMNIFITNGQISQIHETDFRGMTGLYNLYLSGNPVFNISEYAFKSQRELGFLYLDDTLMTTIPKAIKNIRLLNTINMNNARVACSCESLGWMKEWMHDVKSTPNIVGDCFNIERQIHDYVINDIPHCQGN
ncbi:hypothetical protein FSP39_010541, partial [Pinctada imbricata]